MELKKKNVNKYLIFFLFTHLFIWTLVPSISNINLPLDTIEALAWGNDFQFGYSKHPPLSAWFVDFFYKIFKNQDWSYYFLSQLFVIISFIIIFKFSENFFRNSVLSLISIFLLEGIYFFNYTSVEFNVNVCQLPFWALSVFYCWEGVEKNETKSWVLFGLFAALGFLSKYLFVYLLLALDLFFLYLLFNKKINFKCLISLISFFLVLLPHLFWLIDNDYSTIKYALFRSVDDPLSGFGNYEFLNHLFYPLIFLGKQLGILLPFFIMLFFLIPKFKKKINYKDKKFLFLASVTILPIFLIFFTSFVTGARIRTMGMTPFYSFMGVFFVYLFQEKINTAKLKKFISTFLLFFILTPAIYFIVSSTQKNKRTDYPGKNISELVQKKWLDNFSNEIEIVVGYGWIDGWYAQNLSYNLTSRPKWKEKFKQDPDVGAILIKDFNKIKDCSGVLFQIEPYNDICMLGKK